jgi:predicted metalloendopeptidase
VAPFLNWTDFVDKYMRAYNSTEYINENDTIIVLDKNYFLNLTELIKNETTQTIQVYAYINLLKYLFPLLSQEYSSVMLALREALTGATQAERFQTCLEHIDSINTFGFASSRLFIRKKFSGTKQYASDMINRLRDSISANFPQNLWMDNETRILADDKLMNILDMIGYPDFIMNDDQLNQK